MDNLICSEGTDLSWLSIRAVFLFSKYQHQSHHKITHVMLDMELWPLHQCLLMLAKTHRIKLKMLSVISVFS